MTPDEAVLLARKFKAGDYRDIPSVVNVCIELADFILAQSGAAESVPPAVPSEHGLQNAVLAPGGSSLPPGGSRMRPSIASFACCNDCSTAHHHCPSCGGYVKGNDVLYCSMRCEKRRR